MNVRKEFTGNHTLARALKDWREGVGLSQEQTAAKSGIGVKLYSAFETGRRAIRDDHIEAVCATFGCTVAEFVASVHDSELIHVEAFLSLPDLVTVLASGVKL